MTANNHQNNPATKKSRKWILAAILAAAVLITGGVGVFWYLNTPSMISITAGPNQTSYDYGAQLDTTGLTLEVTYNSGRTEVLQEGYTCSPTVLNTAGTQEITVTYQNITTSFTVEAIPVLTGIQVVSQPETSRYLIGEVLSTNGLTLEASYNDGSTRTITEGFICSPNEFTQLGDQEITVTYEDQTTVFTAAVVEVTDISVRTLSAKQVYMVGEQIDPAGISLDVTYSNGDTGVIREGFTCSSTPFAEPGTQDVTVSYGGKDTALPVEVFPAVTFDNLEVTCTSVRYGDGTGLNASGQDVNWAILFDFDLEADIREHFPPTISCSWDHVVNGEGQWEQECSYESAKNGTTYAETGIWLAENSHTGKERFTFMLYLPDDPSIDGEQSATLHVGNSELTVYFTLTYAGDYETGTGWRIYDIY